MRLCWRHELAMFWAAWSTLLDLTGRMYWPASQKVLSKADKCPRCTYRRVR